MKCMSLKPVFFAVFTSLLTLGFSQNATQLKVNQLIEKKAEYHRLTNGETDGYRIKIHFGIEKEVANNIRSKFSAKFSDLSTYQEYQQPNWVVLVGDFKTKLEAFEVLKKIQVEFTNAFIVKEKVKLKM